MLGNAAVVVDIECVGSPKAAQLMDPVRAPANYKDPQKIATYEREEFDNRVKRAALEADLCEVVSVGYQFDTDERAIVFTRLDMPEWQLLVTAWDAIGVTAPRTIIGYNIFGYDLPVLIRRSQVLGVPFPTLTLDRYRSPHLDLIEELSFKGKLPYRSLGFYCRLFSIPCDDISVGADIADLVAASDWVAVQKHCRADVEKTTALARRLGYLPARNAA